MTSATIEEIRSLARDAAERSAAAQGLPARITDRAAMAHVAALMHVQNDVEPAGTPARRKDRNADGRDELYPS
jgi:hypothetical protein